MNNPLGDCQYRHDWVLGRDGVWRCDTCEAILEKDDSPVFTKKING